MDIAWECWFIIDGKEFSGGVGDLLDTLPEWRLSEYDGTGKACTKGGGESGAGGIACSSAGGGEEVSDELRSEEINDGAVRLFFVPEPLVPTARAIAARVAELELRREPGER